MGPLLEGVGGLGGGGGLSFEEGRSGFGSDESSGSMFSHRIMDLYDRHQCLVHNDGVFGG